MRRRRRRVLVKTNTERLHYAQHKKYARTLILERVAYWRTLIPVAPGKIAVKDQRSRWGSCSTKGNLNFNYRLAFLPLPIADYVIVHELTHLIEFNHSQNFWNKVGEVLPDYKERKHTLAKYSLTLISHEALTSLPSPLLTPLAENASLET